MESIATSREPHSAELADNVSGPPPEETTPPAPRKRRYSAQSWLTSSQLPILLILALTFLSRFQLAGWNSYWYDELLSVNVYAGWHDTLTEAIRALADNSIHPPLYQLTLYNWIEWFGDTELATRTLSNLYITLATLCLYLLVTMSFGRRLALLAAVAFSLMNIPTYYALESRSYAQTIFLATLSSYLLLKVLHRLNGTDGVKVMWSPGFIAFAATNVALLLTHYYNFFFLAAQGLFGLCYAIWNQKEGRLRRSGILVAGYLVQLSIFWVIWGPILLADVERRAGAFPAEDGLRSPLQLLLSSVITPNVRAPRWVEWLGLIVGLAVVLGALKGVASYSKPFATRFRSWTTLYLVAWLALPVTVVYVTFAVTGVARYSLRYFVFSVPAVAALIPLTTDEIAKFAARAVRRSRSAAPSIALSTALSLTLTTTLVLPGAHAAATTQKEDFRGIAELVVELVRADQAHSYIIYEAGHRRPAMFDYYLQRFGFAEPSGTLRSSEEARGDYEIFTTGQSVIREHDYLIVVFPHLRTAHFPKALAMLEGHYSVRHRQLDARGRGFIVFDVAPAIDA